VRAPPVLLFDHVIFLLGGAGPTSLAPALVVPSLAAAVDAALAPSEVTLVPGSLVPATKISFAPRPVDEVALAPGRLPALGAPPTLFR